MILLSGMTHWREIIQNIQAQRGQWKYTEMSAKVKGHMIINELKIITHVLLFTLEL
jgi:hypothetical protein